LATLTTTRKSLASRVKAGQRIFQNYFM